MDVSNNYHIVLFTCFTSNVETDYQKEEGFSSQAIHLGVRELVTCFVRTVVDAIQKEEK